MTLLSMIVVMMLCCKADTGAILQQPLAETRQIDVLGIHKTAVLELEWMPYLPVVLTYIALGSPPQAFAVAIDLDFGALAVRNDPCDHCGRTIFSYNESASALSHDLQTRFELSMPGHRAYGQLYSDEAHLAAVPFKATFGSVDRMQGENIGVMIMADFCDGALGLAYPNKSTTVFPAPWRPGEQPEPVLRPNFLAQLVESGALERNVMTLSLPRTRDVRGKLIFGESPDTDLRIPLSKNATSELQDAWKVDLTNISFGSLSLDLDLVAGIHLDMSDSLAVPGHIRDRIWEYLGAHKDETENLIEGIIDCDRLSSLPDITIKLGGHEMQLNWQSYASAWRAGQTCVVNIVEVQWTNDSAWIGWKLLKGFDLVFDMDEDELGLIRV